MLPGTVVVTVSAQVLVEPDVVTDSIDIFSGSEKPQKSRTVAAVSSLLLPGLGHQYQGNSRRALAYFGAEALFVCGMVFSERYSQRLFQDSRSYASIYADAAGGSGADDYYWQSVGRFNDSEEYNRIMELNRTPEDKYSEDNLWWQWIDEVYRDEYNGQRENATRFHVVSSFFIAAMVINRVVAFIDIRRSTRYKGMQGRNAFDIHPQFSPGRDELGLSLVGRF